MIKAIEKVLGATIPSKGVDDFNYDVPTPKNNQEFARPPRQPNPRRKPQQKKRSTGTRKPSESTSSGNSRPGNPKQRPAGKKPTAGSKPRRGGNFRSNRSK